jgi:hypothetical protein
VDQPHEILVTKLCALLGRSELRDLEDVRALLDAEGDLARALADAPRKEAGFSPVTLAWVLEQLPVAAMGRALGRTADEIRGRHARALSWLFVGGGFVASPLRAHVGGVGFPGSFRHSSERRAKA